MMFKTTADSFYKTSTRKGTSMSFNPRNGVETNENDGSIANKSDDKSDHTANV